MLKLSSVPLLTFLGPEAEFCLLIITAVFNGIIAMTLDMDMDNGRNNPKITLQFGSHQKYSNIKLNNNEQYRY